MRTGKLSISRGYQISEDSAPRLALVPSARPELSAAPEPPAGAEMAMPAAVRAPASPDYHLVHDRLTALERLTRLVEQGALSPEEFAAEKAIILSLPADELVLRPSPPAPVSFFPAAPRKRPRGPSLLGRLFGRAWLPVGLLVGVGLGLASQPEATMRFFDETLRLFGI